MAKPLLIVGNRNYSSWSLRAHMALAMAGIPFEEKMIRMFVPSFASALAKYKVAGKVPVLAHNGQAIWDTLAIIEYAAETWPSKNIWPKNKKARALARSISAETHSSFQALRNACPMNLRRPKRLPPGGISEAVAKDVARIEAIWAQCRKAHGKGGPFLFGKFTAADAMFAPVAARIDTFTIPVSGSSRAYVDAILTTTAFQQWKTESAKEPWIIEEDEVD
jgi:glutathione S-transferase